MYIGQHACLSLMSPGKLHAALLVDVLYTKIHSIHSDGFNGDEYPMARSSVSKTCRRCTIRILKCGTVVIL